jgi:transglutaminase-like putative cysteine protease
MKYLSLFLSLLLLAGTAKSQDDSFGTVTLEDLELKNTTLDSHANAIVIKEYGTSSIAMNDADGTTQLNHVYKIRIKILNSSGFEHGNVVVPIYKYGDKEEYIDNLLAKTVILQNGRMVETLLDKKKVFTENKSKYLSLYKFTLPNLQPGCVIEYSYRLTSPRIFNFKTWEMQSEIPKLRSEYLVNIPAIYNYNVSLRGALKLNAVKPELYKECLSIAGTKIDCSKILYSMDNIPAFVEEDYMTAPSNFKSAIYFELSDIQRLNGSKQDITKTWKDVDYELVSDRAFGSQIKRKDLFKAAMPEILKNTSDPLSKAKAVYQYIQKNIKWDNYYGMYSPDNIKKALDMHSGSTADINLALIAALMAADLDAEALILSTRNNGTVNDLFPVISNFNYVVAKVNIDNKSYLLDASDPLLPFGLLPLHCINDRGRVINLKKPSYWYDLKASQKNSVRHSLEANLTPEGKIKGKLVTYSMGYAALNKRNQIKRANGVDEYVEHLDEQMPRIRIVKHEIFNIDSVENPLIEKYDLEIDAFDQTGLDRIFFNPFFLDRVVKNPFNLNERTYPVDMGAAYDQQVFIKLNLPGAYTISDRPKNISLALAEAGGKYMTSVGELDNSVVFHQVLKLDRPTYQPHEYLSLKEFYSRIIQQQKTDIVLKKVK